MTKVVIIHIILGILLFVVIVLHALSIFSSCTLFGLKEEQYKVLVSDAIFMLAFGIALIPLIQASQNTRKLRQELKKAQEQFQKEQGIQSFPIEEKGKDDIKWMLPHYRTAEHVTIFAGSFDWLGQKKEMRDQIIKLAKEGNLELVSRRTKAEVDRSLEEDVELYETLSGHFHYESELNGVTCTMIKALGTQYKFLYRSSTTEPGKAFNARVFTNTEQSRELLHILSQLTKAEHWGKPAVDSSSTEQG